VARVKFCGLTRPEDAALAGELGAAYVGAIFAGGPRELTPERARDVLGAAGGTTRRVGVFGSQSAAEVGRTAAVAGLDVVQLHADPDARAVDDVRAHFAGEVWAVVRTDGALPEGLRELASRADAILLDARVPGTLGGSGVALPWAELRGRIADLRVEVPIVLAGGLRPGNIVEAVRAFAPAVVDVSSGVERSPGVKDHGLMRDFVRALAQLQE
jgi:phosphoribosylanthranilate isomerase